MRWRTSDSSSASNEVILISLIDGLPYNPRGTYLRYPAFRDHCDRLRVASEAFLG